jgi:hypothetical protein
VVVAKEKIVVGGIRLSPERRRSRGAASGEDVIVSNEGAVEEFAKRILEKYKDAMEAIDYRLISEDLEAGEFEVGAISAAEMAPVDEAEIDELLTLAEKQFSGIDAEVAPLVAQKARQRLQRGQF